MSQFLVAGGTKTVIQAITGRQLKIRIIDYQVYNSLIFGLKYLSNFSRFSLNQTY